LLSRGVQTKGIRPQRLPGGPVGWFKWVSPIESLRVTLSLSLSVCVCVPPPLCHVRTLRSAVSMLVVTVGVCASLCVWVFVWVFVCGCVLVGVCVCLCVCGCVWVCLRVNKVESDRDPSPIAWRFSDRKSVSTGSRPHHTALGSAQRWDRGNPECRRVFVSSPKEPRSLISCVQIH